MSTGTLSAFYSSGSGEFWFVVVCLAGTVAGPLLFFSGFRMFRYKRMILNTPLSRIHSASIGLVEVMGAPTGPHTLNAPVTGDPCYYYQVQAWQWVESGNSHHWKQVVNESAYLPFFLKDNTGRVLIDPQGAEMDVHRSFSDEIGASCFNSRELPPENIRNFLVMRGLVPYDKIKVEERIIQPGYPLFVFGTRGDNSAPGTWAPRPHVAGGGAVSVNVLGDKPGIGITLQKTLTVNRLGVLNSVATVLSHVPGVEVTRFETQLPAAGGQPMTPAAAVAALNRSGLTIPAGVLTALAANVAAPEENASVNSGEQTFDLHPKGAITKGERGDPFTISRRSPKEVVQSLAWKPTLYIWGGPVLCIVCLYLLLLYWGFISSK